MLTWRQAASPPEEVVQSLPSWWVSTATDAAIEFWKTISEALCLSVHLALSSSSGLTIFSCVLEWASASVILSSEWSSTRFTAPDAQARATVGVSKFASQRILKIPDVSSVASSWTTTPSEADVFTEKAYNLHKTYSEVTRFGTVCKWNFFVSGWYWWHQKLQTITDYIL